MLHQIYFTYARLSHGVLLCLLWDYHERITIDPLIRSGKPCVRGTRIAVTDVLDHLGGGMTLPEMLADFPDLKAEDVQACLSFAADREHHLLVPAS